MVSRVRQYDLESDLRWDRFATGDPEFGPWYFEPALDDGSPEAQEPPENGTPSKPWGLIVLLVGLGGAVALVIGLSLT